MSRTAMILLGAAFAAALVGVLVLRSQPLRAQGSDPIVGITLSGDYGWGYAVSTSGDSYSQRNPGIWDYEGNVFALTGQPSNSRLVGLAHYDHKIYALAEDGRLFGSDGGGSWWLDTSFGGGPYTALGMRSHGSFGQNCLLAVRESGDVVTCRSAGPFWCPSGNVLDSRPTQTRSSTWGRVKAERR